MIIWLKNKTSTIVDWSAASLEKKMKKKKKIYICIAKKNKFPYRVEKREDFWEQMAKEKPRKIIDMKEGKTYYEFF